MSRTQMSSPRPGSTKLWARTSTSRSSGRITSRLLQIYSPGSGSSCDSAPPLRAGIGVRRRVGSTAVTLPLLALAACQKADPLLPAETFRWAEQPISFSPPPEGWRREGYGQGGLKGLTVIKTGSLGERITVPVHYVIRDLDNTAQIRDV